jgi:hypothetical protein
MAKVFFRSKIKFLFFILQFLFFSFQLFASSNPDSADYYSGNFLRYDDYVYLPNIKTVKIFPSTNPLSEPLLELNTGAQLKLEFDDLEGDYKDYWYTLVHCDNAWQPSTISPMQYLQGFAENRITQYRFSFNTLQHFTHYELMLPNEDVQMKFSGNYILKVFLNNDPDKLVLTRKIMVFENFVHVTAHVHQATDVEERNARQEVDFSIQYPNYQIQNPFGDLHVVVMQNGRWDNVITNLKPLYLKDHELDYDYDEGNVFNGGSEFRNFDTRSLRYETQNVKSIKRNDDGYDIFLFPDKRKSSSRYSKEFDINGKYEVRTYDGNDDNLASDYFNAHFSLPLDIPAIDGNYYVFGELTGWKYLPQSKMKYNYEQKMYEATLFLKQGYYNYEYVFLKDGSQIGDETIIEGSHFETENKYTILVYHHPVGARYDMLVGITSVDY